MCDLREVQDNGIYWQEKLNNSDKNWETERNIKWNNLKKENIN